MDVALKWSASNKSLKGMVEILDTNTKTIDSVKYMQLARTDEFIYVTVPMDRSSQ